MPAEIPTKTIPRLNGRRYPWDEWFLAATSHPVRLVRGIDFSGRTDTFLQQLRRAAVTRRLGLEIEVTTDRKTLWVRVVRLLGLTRRKGRRKKSAAPKG